MLLDENGFAMPWPDDDGYIEAEAECNGEVCGPAEGWPCTPGIDGERWVPSDDDWNDYRNWCEHVDLLDAIRRIEDSEWEARMRFGE
jgi:hypothetical protein